MSLHDGTTPDISRSGYADIVTKPVHATPPKSAQLESTPCHSPKLHPGLCSSMGMRRGTVRQTHRHRRAWSIYI